MTRADPRAWRILVAGGGIPSLAFALACVRGAGRAVALTVADPGRAGPDDGRAYTLSAASVAMLAALDVWPDLAGRAQPVTAMRITDGRPDDAIRPEYLRFDGRDGEPLAQVVEAGVLADVLAASCRAAGIAFETWPVEDPAASPAGIEVAEPGGGRRVASLLVAADGARSRLREAAQFGWVGRPYRQWALVGTIAHARDHGGLAVQHFLPGGPFATLPLAGPGRAFPFRSSLVWTDDGRRARALLASPPGAAEAEIARLCDAAFGEAALDDRLRGHPLAVGLARTLARNRMALLGDAAHAVHPLAGQGLNLGLADAASLAEHVVDSVRLGLDPGRDDVLRAYERDRRADALRLAVLTDGLNTLFSNDRLPVRALRDFGLGLVGRSPVKAALARAASGRSPRGPRLLNGEPI